VICLHLISSLIMSRAGPCQFVCDFVLLLVFYDFLFVFSLVSFMFEGLWNWLGKRKVNGAQGELNETKQVM